MRDQVVIGFAGKIGCGKSTAADYLETRYGFKRVRFAGPLKAMMAALGLSKAEIEGAYKETPCELLGGKTPRHAMQTLGTQWGRNLIGEDLWVNAWRRATEGWPLAVADDVRFPNEAKAIRDAGGVVIRIIRPGVDGTGVEAKNWHASEAQDFAVDATFRNDEGIRELVAKVEALVDPLVHVERYRVQRLDKDQVAVMEEDKCLGVVHSEQLARDVVRELRQYQ